MALEQCKTAIESALGRELTDRETRIVNARATELAARLKNSNDPDVINDVLKKFSNEVAFNRELQKRSTALNYAAFAKAEAWRKNTPFALKNPAEAFKGFMRGSLYNFDGSKNSVASLVQHESNARSGAFLADLEKANLKKYAFSGGDDLNITRAWSDIKNGTEPDAAKYGTSAVQVAEIADKHLEAIRQDQNRAGAWISKQGDRLWRRTHDANKIARAGDNDWGSDESRDAWSKFTGDRMDWSKAFDGEYAEASPNVQKTVLHGLWQSFKDNDHYKPGEAHPPVGLGTRNIAKKLSHGRQIIFNSPEDELAYNQQFGTGSSVAENVFHNLSGGGRDLALMRKLGPNPESTLMQFAQSWRNDVEGENSEYTGDQRKQLKKTIDDEHDNTWRLITEGGGHPNDNFVGRFAQAVRGITNTAALGMSVFSLPGDLALRARMVSQATGESFAKNLLSGTADMFTGTGISKADRQSLFAELGLRTEGVNLPLDPNQTDNVGFGKIAKFNQQVMSVTGHSWWDNKFRLNSLVADAYRHWSLRDKSFDQLDPQQQNSFKQFGMDKTSWDVIRSSEGTQIGKGINGITPDNIAKMSLDSFKPLAGDGATDVQLKRAQTDLVEKYRNYMGELSDRSTSSPSIANNAAMGMGYKGRAEGTPFGEIYRGAFQLKGWAINYMRNHLGGEMFGYDNQPATWGQAMADMLKGNNPKGLTGLAKVMSAGVVIAMATNAMRDVATGKSPEDPLSSHGIQRAFARQFMGVYSDFLFQDVKPDASFWDRIGNMAGPEEGLVSDTFDLGNKVFNQIRSDNGPSPEQVGSDERELFQNVYRRVPGTSLFWAKAAMDYAILNNISESLNPGYQQRLIDNAQKQGQGFLAGGPGPQTNAQQ